MTNLMIIKLVVLLSLLVVPIKANVELMKEECSHTDYETTCLKCLKSDLNSEHENLFGFSQILIGCLESQVHILITNVTNLSTRKRESGALKQVLIGCNTGLLNATFKLHQVKHGLVLHNYENAMRLVKTALSYPLTCRDNLQKLKFKEAHQVYEEISVYDKLSSSACTFIHRLMTKI
ncbi:unnamed protein product [Cochlearia groenlandica]